MPLSPGAVPTVVDIGGGQDLDYDVQGGGRGAFPNAPIPPDQPRTDVLEADHGVQDVHTPYVLEQLPPPETPPIFPPVADREPGIILTTPESLPPGAIVETGVPVPLGDLPVPDAGYDIRRVPDDDVPEGYPIVYSGDERIGRLIEDQFTTLPSVHENILPGEQSFGPPPFIGDEYLPEGSGMPEAGPSRRPGEPLIPSMRAPPQETDFDKLIRRDVPRQDRGGIDDVLRRPRRPVPDFDPVGGVRGPSVGGAIIIGEVLKEAVKVLTRRRAEPVLRPGPGGFSPPPPVPPPSSPETRTLPPRPDPMPRLPVPSPEVTWPPSTAPLPPPTPGPTTPSTPAPGTMSGPTASPVGQPGLPPALAIVLPLLPLLMPRSQNVTPRALEWPGTVSLAEPLPAPGPLPLEPSGSPSELPSPLPGPASFTPFGPSLTTLKTSALRSRDDCPPCKCHKPKRSKRRKCLTRADVVWASGAKKGQKAGSRCTSFQR
jgi:hypothetical protein